MKSDAFVPFFAGFVLGCVFAGFVYSLTLDCSGAGFDADASFSRLEWYLDDVPSRVPLWQSQFHNGTLTLNDALAKHNHYSIISDGVARKLMVDVCTYRSD